LLNKKEERLVRRKGGYEKARRARSAKENGGSPGKRVHPLGMKRRLSSRQTSKVQKTQKTRRRKKGHSGGKGVSSAPGKGAEKKKRGKGTKQGLII